MCCLCTLANNINQSCQMLKNWALKLPCEQIDSGSLLHALMVFMTQLMWMAKASNWQRVLSQEMKCDTNKQECIKWVSNNRLIGNLEWSNLCRVIIKGNLSQTIWKCWYLFWIAFVNENKSAWQRMFWCLFGTSCDWIILNSGIEWLLKEKSLENVCVNMTVKWTQESDNK